MGRSEYTDIMEAIEVLWEIGNNKEKNKKIYTDYGVNDLNEYLIDDKSKKKLFKKDERVILKLYFHEKIINNLKDYIERNVEERLENLTDDLVKFYQEYNVKFYKELTGLKKESTDKTAEKEYYFKVKSLDALMQAEKYQKEQIYRLARKFNVDFDNKKTLDENLDTLQEIIDDSLEEEEATKGVVNSIKGDINNLGEKININEEERSIWLK